MQKTAKLDMLKNLAAYMHDFTEVLDFTVKELEDEMNEEIPNYLIEDKEEVY